MTYLQPVDLEVGVGIVGGASVLQPEGGAVDTPERPHEGLAHGHLMEVSLQEILQIHATTVSAPLLLQPGGQFHAQWLPS